MSAASSRLALVLVLFASPLYYYAVFEPSMSHVYDLLAFVLYLLGVLRWVEREGWSGVAALSLTGGLLILVRPQNAATVALFSAILFFLPARPGRDGAPIAFSRVRRLAACAFPLLLGVLPILALNHYLYGGILAVKGAGSDPPPHRTIASSVKSGGCAGAREISSRVWGTNASESHRRPDSDTQSRLGPEGVSRSGAEGRDGRAPEAPRRGREEGRPDPRPPGDLQRAVLLPVARTRTGTTRPSRCPGRRPRRSRRLAKKYRMAIVVPVYEREDAGVYYNTAAVIDADGTYLGKYRKNHIPHTSGFWEKFFFKPGNMGYPVFQTRYAKVGVYICYDRHFPEGARALGLNGAEIVFNPSATVAGLSQYLWKLEQPAHAVANGYFVAASNRVGTEAPWNIGKFYGSCYFVDPRGNFLATASEDKDELLVATCDLDMIEEVRRTWQFFRDRRPETYDALVAL